MGILAWFGLGLFALVSAMGGVAFCNTVEFFSPPQHLTSVSNYKKYEFLHHSWVLLSGPGPCQAESYSPYRVTGNLNKQRNPDKEGNRISDDKSHSEFLAVEC